MKELQGLFEALNILWVINVSNQLSSVGALSNRCYQKKKKQPLTRQLTISSYGSAAGRLVYLFLMKYGVFLYVFVMALLTLGNPFL